MLIPAIITSNLIFLSYVIIKLLSSLFLMEPAQIAFCRNYGLLQKQTRGKQLRIALETIS